MSTTIVCVYGSLTPIYFSGRAITALFPFIAGLLMSRGVSPVHVVIAIGAVPVLGFLFSCLKLVETKNIVL